MVFGPLKKVFQISYTLTKTHLREILWLVRVLKEKYGESKSLKEMIPFALGKGYNFGIITLKLACITQLYGLSFLVTMLAI